MATAEKSKMNNRWTSEHLTQLKFLIHAHAGIQVTTETIQSQLSALDRIRAQQSIAAVTDFIQMLKRPESSKILQTVCEVFLIHETYFFREFPQLKVFAEQLLEPLIQTKIKQGDPSLRIWSAACSTGEEPYTLAIILKAFIQSPEIVSQKIIATDLDPASITKAKDGVYFERSIRQVPEAYLSQYFTALPDDRWQVKREIKAFCEFREFNLLQDPAQSSGLLSFDFIFCRNTMIYFDAPTRAKIVSYFVKVLKTNGVLFLGTSEATGVRIPGMESRTSEGITYFVKTK